MVLTFNEADHEYFLGKKRLPSVSEIIAPLKDFSMIPPDVLENKRQFGTAVHKMVELYLEDDLAEDSLSEDLQGCLDAFKKWEREDIYLNADKFLSSALIEQKRCHASLGYAGTPDIDTMGVVIDIKSRDFDPIVDPLQLSAYKNFGDPKRAGYILSLFPDGTYKFKKVPEKQSWQIFRKMLKHWKDVQEFNQFVDKVKRWQR